MRRPADTMNKPEGPRFRRYTSETRAAMLVEAGLVCLAKGGITAFTVDNICREAKASRGLITHHFGSKDALLAAVYATMYDRLIAVMAPEGAEEPDLVTLVEANLAPDVFNRDSLKIWLALWGEIANSADLQTVHRRRLVQFRDTVARAVEVVAKAKGIKVDAQAIAVAFIALTDGLWLEQGIDPTMLSREAARETCYGMLEAHLGRLDRPRSGG